MDSVLQYFNAHNHNNITLEYSTASQYVEALNKEKEQTWPVMKDDFMAQ